MPNGVPRTPGSNNGAAPTPTRFRSKLSADDNELGDGAVITTHGTQAAQEAATVTSPGTLASLMARAGLTTGASTSVSTNVTGSSIKATAPSLVAKVDAVDAEARGDSKVSENEGVLKPVTAPKVHMTESMSRAAKVFATNVDRAMTNAMIQSKASLRALASSPDANSPEAMASRIHALSPDQLLTEFLKLNINDPNENVQTYNTLYDLASKMREMAIEEAQKKIENAIELMREAQKYADQVEQYADMAGMLGMVMGLLGPLGAIMSAIMQIVVAIAQYQAAQMMADAKEEKNNGERFNFMGDMHQDQIQDTAQIINDIMQHKNDMVDAVLQMSASTFASKQQLLSASMAR